MKISVPYLISKPGKGGTTRWFWQPSSELRKLGWRSVRLCHPDGRPAVTLDEAAELAKVRNAELDAWRKGGAPVVPSIAPPPPEEVRPGTVAALIRDYKASARFTSKRASTQRDYLHNLGIIEAWSGDAPLRAITPELVQDYYEQLLSTGKHAKANSVLRVLRLLFNFARKSNRSLVNPAERPGMIATAPRLRVASPEEIDLLVDKADKRGWHCIGDAVLYGCYIGQRQGDLLKLPVLAVQAEGLGWRAHIKQSKRNARVSIPLHPRTAARFAAAQQRRKDLGIKAATVLWNDQTGEPWKADTFRHVFADLRDEIAREHHRVAEVRQEKGVTQPELARKLRDVPVAEIEAREVVPSTEDLLRIGKALGCELGSLLHPIHDLWFMDLRDTAVTNYATAGSTIPEICALTGHTEANAHQVLKHYLALNGEMANSAVAKLVAYEEAKRQRQKAAAEE